MRNNRLLVKTLWVGRSDIHIKRDLSTVSQKKKTVLTVSKSLTFSSSSESCTASCVFVADVLCNSSSCKTAKTVSLLALQDLTTTAVHNYTHHWASASIYDQMLSCNRQSWCKIDLEQCELFIQSNKILKVSHIIQLTFFI